MDKYSTSGCTAEVTHKPNYIMVNATIFDIATNPVTVQLKKLILVLRSSSYQWMFNSGDSLPPESLIFFKCMTVCTYMISVIISRNKRTYFNVLTSMTSVPKIVNYFLNKY